MANCTTSRRFAAAASLVAKVEAIAAATGKGGSPSVTAGGAPNRCSPPLACPLYVRDWRTTRTRDRSVRWLVAFDRTCSRPVLLLDVSQLSPT
jgi:hypothetical protein